MFGRFKKLSRVCGNSRYCLIDALAKHIRERLELRMTCTVFEDSLARVWPVGPVADPKRAERIHAFAKANGWTATIHENGTQVAFKKLAAWVQTDPLASDAKRVLQGFFVEDGADSVLIETQ